MACSKYLTFDKFDSIIQSYLLHQLLPKWANSGAQKPLRAYLFLHPTEDLRFSIGMISICNFDVGGESFYILTPSVNQPLRGCWLQIILQIDLYSFMCLDLGLI